MLLRNCYSLGRSAPLLVVERWRGRRRRRRRWRKKSQAKSKKREAGGFLRGRLLRFRVADWLKLMR